MHIHYKSFTITSVNTNDGDMDLWSIWYAPPASFSLFVYSLSLLLVNSLFSNNMWCSSQKSSVLSSSYRLFHKIQKLPSLWPDSLIRVIENLSWTTHCTFCWGDIRMVGTSTQPLAYQDKYTQHRINRILNKITNYSWNMCNRLNWCVFDKMNWTIFMWGSVF